MSSRRFVQVICHTQPWLPKGNRVRASHDLLAQSGDAIGAHVSKSYFPHFATILDPLPVQVQRERKFTQS